jgi:hypothetical protein
VLRLYEQYCIEKVIVSLQKLTDLLDSIMPLPEKKSE